MQAAFRLRAIIVFAMFVLTPGAAPARGIEPAAPGVSVDPRGALSLHDAIDAVLRGNRELATVAVGLSVQDGRLVQAGLLPNPELHATVDNFGGTGRNRGFDAAESSLRLAQLVELGGKRVRRQAVAGLERDAIAWDLEVRRANVLAATARAFIAVLALQERTALAGELTGVADRSAQAVEAQVRAGAGSPAEALRARVAATQSASERTALDRELAAARIALAELWGNPLPTFDRAAGDLWSIDPLPALNLLLDRVGRNPDVARWATELALRDAAIAVEQARAVPNVTVGVGPSYYADAGGAGFVLELAIPLPVFDRNQGAIAAARAERRQSERGQAAAAVLVRGALARAYESAGADAERARALRDRVLPMAEEAFRSTEQAYRAGAQRALDVFDAQRTLFTLRDQYVAALAAYHVAVVDIDRLVGAPMGDEPPASSPGSEP